MFNFWLYPILRHPIPIIIVERPVKTPEQIIKELVLTTPNKRVYLNLMISEREKIQNSLVAIFSEKGLNTNPLGNDTYLAKFGKGECRVVNFGLARYLDAQAIIYQPNKIEIRAEGPLANRYRGMYKSVAEIEELVYN